MSDLNKEKNQQYAYNNEQQTITILRTESTALEQRLGEEKERSKKEVEMVQQTMKKIYNLLERKLDSALTEIENLRKKEKDFSEYMEKTKAEHLKDIKKCKSDVAVANKKLSESQYKFAEERKKYNERISRLEATLVQKEEEHKRMLHNKMNKLSSILEDKNKILNTSTL
jgi:hypothetical protein